MFFCCSCCPWRRSITLESDQMGDMTPITSTITTWTARAMTCQPKLLARLSDWVDLVETEKSPSWRRRRRKVIVSPVHLCSSVPWPIDDDGGQRVLLWLLCPLGSKSCAWLARLAVGQSVLCLRHSPVMNRVWRTEDSSVGGVRDDHSFSPT